MEKRKINRYERNNDYDQGNQLYIYKGYGKTSGVGNTIKVKMEKRRIKNYESSMIMILMIVL